MSIAWVWPGGSALTLYGGQPVRLIRRRSGQRGSSHSPRAWYNRTMQSKATTVDQYLAELPAARREAIEAVRVVILENLSTGYEEGMQYGMIGYYVPHSVYPAGYHCDSRQPLPFAALASQKNYMSIYLNCIYSNPDQEAWFREAWAKSGKKLDMGKSCIRFKSIDDVPLAVIGQSVKRVPMKKFVEYYEAAVRLTGKRAKAASGTRKKSAVKRTARKP